MKASDVTGSQRLAGQVKRYHTWITHQTQSVAEHSWQMARIYRELWGMVPATTAEYIQFHDAGEVYTGDLPFPVKSLHPQIKQFMDDLEVDALKAMGVRNIEISAGEKQRVKLCDLIEMWEFGAQEFTMGNAFSEPIVDRTMDAIEKLCDQFPNPQEIRLHVVQLLEKARTWTSI